MTLTTVAVLGALGKVGCKMGSEAEAVVDVVDAAAFFARLWQQ